MCTPPLQTMSVNYRRYCRNNCCLFLRNFASLMFLLVFLLLKHIHVFQAMDTFCSPVFPVFWDTVSLYSLYYLWTQLVNNAGHEVTEMCFPLWKCHCRPLSWNSEVYLPLPHSAWSKSGLQCTLLFHFRVIDWLARILCFCICQAYTVLVSFMHI